jgi:hypothetical protein
MTILHRITDLPPVFRPSNAQAERNKVMAGILAPRPRTLHTLCTGWTRIKVSKRLCDQDRERNIAKNRERLRKERLTGAVSEKPRVAGIGRVSEAQMVLSRHRSLKKACRECGTASEIWLLKHGYRVGGR